MNRTVNAMPQMNKNDKNVLKQNVGQHHESDGDFDDGSVDRERLYG